MKQLLCPDNVPAAIVPLLALAEVWGIGDDIDRSAKIEAASDRELQGLIDEVDAVGDDDLYGWLSGPEVDVVPPSREYVAVTCLTMAADIARIRLGK